jgi:hypothetical protein
MTSGNGARILPSSSYCFRSHSQAFRTMHSRSLHLGFHPVACPSLEHQRWGIFGFQYSLPRL